VKKIQIALLVAALLSFHSVALAQSWLASDDSRNLGKIENPSGNDTAKFHAEGLPSLTFSQAQYSESWKDGSNSLGFRAAFLGSTTYTKKRIFFRNTLDAAYAKSKEGDAPAFTKKEDRLNFNSSFGYAITPAVPLYWVTQLDLKTQFDAGYNDAGMRISNFFAPAYIIASLGARYQSNFGLSAMLSPLSDRMTVVSDTAYCKYVDTDLGGNPRHFRSQLGAYAQIAYDKNISKYVGVKTSLEFFSDYQHRPQNVDVDWTTSVNFNINKWLAVILFNRVVYRDLDRYSVKVGVDEITGSDIVEVRGPRVQWTESLNVGITYKFATK
jgi:hypothetical protein